MHLQNDVRLQDLIEALNVQRAETEEALHFAKQYEAARGVLPRKLTRPFTAAWLSYTLRHFVDAWLQTGRHTDGKEFPSNRRLSDEGSRAVERYLQRYPPTVSFSRQEGLIVYTGDTIGHPVGAGKLYEAVEVEARRLFTGLIISDERRRLGKCPHCGRYFLMLKPRRVYKMGTFCCRSHQMLARALTLTRQRRVQATERRIEFAAEQLLKWNVRTSDWIANDERKRDLASKLSNRVRRNPNLRTKRRDVRDVKVNWVTRHSREIEKRRIQITKRRTV